MFLTSQLKYILSQQMEECSLRSFCTQPLDINFSTLIYHCFREIILQPSEPLLWFMFITAIKSQSFYLPMQRRVPQLVTAIKHRISFFLNGWIHLRHPHLASVPTGTLISMINQLITTLFMNFLICWQSLVNKTHPYQKRKKNTLYIVRTDKFFSPGILL